MKGFYETGTSVEQKLLEPEKKVLIKAFKPLGLRWQSHIHRFQIQPRIIAGKPLTGGIVKSGRCCLLHLSFFSF